MIKKETTSGRLFLFYKNSHNILGYRTKSVAVNADGTS